ncbi:MAG TPA: isoprenylcysteine carboxylmethyltransferase family protein [Candidatus Saccharimonadales bacterium]|jgi:protein-S-isoprenylcysteine O-methyltransferase Ste14|nr:isoprenylcysteine carboxylmethyltransferase family protein [Candidatus Saccharimonadales bacterium]
MASWGRIATRFRVPLGFLMAALYLWLARPSWLLIGVGSVVVLGGVAVRAAASGHIRKNAQLATAGPYAHVRNPLYLGSILIAIGFMIAARNWWIGLAALLMFLVIYLPVIRAEESYLGSAFADYAEYAKHVPRFLPRLTAYRSAVEGESGGFSRELYMRHREYNALLGSGLMLAALALKIILFTTEARSHRAVELQPRTLPLRNTDTHG